MAVDAQIFKPAMDPHGIFSIERARALKQWDLGLKLTTNFAQAPLKLKSVGGDDDADTVFDSTLGIEMGVALGMTDRLSFAFSVPIARQPLGDGYGEPGTYAPVPPDMADVGTGFWSVRPQQNLDPSETPVGDVRVGMKYLIFGGQSLALALQALAYVPFGDEDVFMGSKGFTYEPKLIVEFPLESGVFALNAGARLREGTLVKTRQVNEATGIVMNDTNGNPVYHPLLYVGSEAVVGAGVRLDTSTAMSIGGEIYGLVPIGKAESAECPDGCRNGDLTGDALVGAFFTLSPDLQVAVGAGAGLVPGAARRDTFRVFAQLGWAPTPEGARATGRSDRDGDGLPDGPDVCSDEPEDPDNFQDDDGCPDLDNDLDGILDAQDMCSDEPEDRDGYDDGDGCPEGDNDKDNVSDLVDRCPGEGEDLDGFQDEDGCPDEDNDGDGILDGKDQCANEPETVNGYLDLDGCPDQAVQGGPRMAADRIDLQGERIEFAGPRSSKLTKEARETLDAVAEELKKPEYAKVRIRIEVGVEESGTSKKAKQNDRRLSQERALEVQQYLISKGIALPRLDAVGLGSDRPIDPKNPKDPKLNRRVEFIRVTQ